MPRYSHSKIHQMQENGPAAPEPEDAAVAACEEAGLGGEQLPGQDPV